MRYFLRPPGTPPVNGYSHAVSCSGTIVAVSGQVSVDEDGRIVGIGDPEAQMRQVFHNLGVVLAAAGCNFARVVKLTIYLTDLADLPVFRMVRDEHFDTASAPASSLVQVAGLVDPAFCVEIDAVAVAT